MDFYAHGAMEAIVHRTPIDNLEMLSGRVLQAWNELRVNDCRKAIDEVNQRMHELINHEGNHFDLRL